MSKINKLQILGVRSFDNTRSETIQFYSPLTLIVGYNGSGKTTIVECLKYATCGELPPNSKGGAFIHDPKLAGEKEVLAQVKLSFQATSGAEMVTTRSLQLTVKKTTRSVKTLEGHLHIIKNGEKTSISTRVAELDQIIPQYLGVSTAILDNVIFCHQDESLWPLSEPSVLKKKFDEIFEAQKYTKAIDNIKLLRKKQNEELGKFKLTEQHTKEDKDKAEKIQKRTIKLSDEIEEIRREVTTLTAEMARTSAAADKAWREAESYGQVLGELKGRKIEANSKRTIINDLRAHLKEVAESDEWLESTLEQYESRLGQYHEQEESKKGVYMELKQQIQGSREQLGMKQKKFGEYQNDKAQYERNLVRRQELVKEIARTHNIRGFNESIDEDQFADFMQRLRKLLKDQINLLNRVKQEGDVELREAQTLRNRLDRREEALQHDKQSARQQLAANEEQISQLQTQADQIAVDEGSKAVIESRIEDVSGRLQRTKIAIEQAGRDEKIGNANSELRIQEEESLRLNEELIQGTKKASEMAQLDHLKRELKDRIRSLETMLGAHRDRINKLIGSEWEPSTVETVFQSTVSERTRDCNAVERTREAVSRELEQAEFKLRTVRASLKQKSSELAQAKTRIRNAIDDEPEEFQASLDERQNRLDILRTDASSFGGMQDYMKKCLATVTEKNCCRTCARPFRTPQEAAGFKNKIENLIKKAQTEVSEDEIKQAEADLEAARAASPHYTTWQRLSTTEIPELTQQEQHLETEREGLLAKIEDQDQIVSEKAAAKRDLESLSKTVLNIARYVGDIKDLEKQAGDLTSKQSQSQQGRVRTLEDIRDDISNVAERTRITKQLISKLTNERDQARNETADLELELRDLKAEVNKAGFQMERKTGLITRIEEVKALNKKHRDAINKADKDLEGLGPQILQAKTRYEDTVERKETREAEVQRDASSLTDHSRQLELSNDQIRSYIERDGPRELGRAQREIKNIEDEIARLESEQSSITVEINRIASQLQDSEATRRQYSDNLRYRREVRSLEEVESQIEELAAHNAEVDRERFRRESEKLTREHNNLSARQAGLMGEMKSKDNQLKEMISEWETTYKHAAKQYREAHIRVETSKAAIEDLGRYGGALDKAIMTYHSLKMEEINRIIEELWRDTYRGTDVDTILIRSDNENAKGNRSYNYRVCMVKQGAELDMRGRCSAGQKVLASIIIRLALAECFGTNCGLIALDEPTTNLDRDNVRSLAESLHNIIKARQQQANFQLIVITHDEEFLRSMQCGDFSDYYWRVSRDGRLKSIVERQAIAEVL